MIIKPLIRSEHVATTNTNYTNPKTSNLKLLPSKTTYRNLYLSLSFSGTNSKLPRFPNQ